MHATPIKSVQNILPEQKLSALDAILHSHTFARADQLKSFLKYICERELAGHGQELTEYQIGVEALGRPSSYSPSDDSAVRNRAFALRKKLQEFYEVEEPNAPVRIELTKGSYCPHFFTNVALPNSDSTITHSPSPELEAQLPAPLVESNFALLRKVISSLTTNGWWIGFVAGVALTICAISAFHWINSASQVANARIAPLAPILAEAWGPLFTPEAEVLVCVANPPSISIHPEAVSGSTLATFTDPNSYPSPTNLIEWIKKRFPTTTGQQHLTLTTNATYWGDALGALTVFKTLSPVGAKPNIFPERVLSVPAMRQRNVVLLGSGEYSPAIAHYMEKCPLSANFLNGIAPTGQPENPLYRIKRDHHNRLTQLFGLITVLPSDSSINNQHRTIIFSGINSAGTQAAAEFFSSPESLSALKKQLVKDGQTGFPPAYQVVVRVETDDNILLNYQYEAYRMIHLPES